MAIDKKPKKIVVVLSGGMDSATLLWHLAAQGHDLSAVTINYGQRHGREILAAQSLAQTAGVNWTLVELPGLLKVMRHSSQTDPEIAVPEGHYEDQTMRLTVVPNRNMLLLAVATAHAVSTSADAVAYGAHSGDHAIYPDCRADFVYAMKQVMKTCDYRPIQLMAPFLSMDKGDIALMGASLKVPYEDTWTCYKGSQLACGKCGACQERLEAFAKAGVTDPLPYEAAA